MVGRCLWHLPTFVYFYEVNYVTLDNGRINGKWLWKNPRHFLSYTFILPAFGNGRSASAHEQGQGGLQYRKIHYFNTPGNTVAAADTRRDLWPPLSVWG